MSQKSIRWLLFVILFILAIILFVVAACICRTDNDDDNDNDDDKKRYLSSSQNNVHHHDQQRQLFHHKPHQRRFAKWMKSLFSKPVLKSKQAPPPILQTVHPAVYMINVTEQFMTADGMQFKVQVYISQNDKENVINPYRFQVKDLSHHHHNHQLLWKSPKPVMLHSGMSNVLCITNIQQCPVRIEITLCKDEANATNIARTETNCLNMTSHWNFRRITSRTSELPITQLTVETKEIQEMSNSVIYVERLQLDGEWILTSPSVIIFAQSIAGSGYIKLASTCKYACLVCGHLSTPDSIHWNMTDSPDAQMYILSM